MNINEKAHELGQMIKDSEEMKRMEKAETAQQNDETAQNVMNEFTLQRMNLMRDLQEGKIKQEEAIEKNNQAYYEMMEKNAVVKEYIEAKAAFDELVMNVNKILDSYVVGENVNCTHDCSTCGGCH